jgi:uncharacterized protein DUF6151
MRKSAGRGGPFSRVYVRPATARIARRSRGTSSVRTSWIAAAGTDIVPMSPAGVRIADGLENVSCMSLSDKGRLRWHTACCQTPLANTPRSGKIAYVGMILTCFDATPDAIEAALGPRDRIVLNTASATCKVSSTPLPFLIGGLNILRHIVAARFSAPQSSPFFTPPGPLREPIVLNASQRHALGANPV